MVSLVNLSDLSVSLLYAVSMKKGGENVNYSTSILVMVSEEGKQPILADLSGDKELERIIGGVYHSISLDEGTVLLYNTVCHSSEDYDEEGVLINPPNDWRNLPGTFVIGTGEGHIYCSLTAAQINKYFPIFNER